MSDGSALAFGSNYAGESTIPPIPIGRSVVDVAAGQAFSLYLLDDGTILTSGDNSLGQLTVPSLPPGLTYVALAAGEAHSLALRSDGVVVAFGDNSDFQCNVPPLSPGARIIDIAAGGDQSLARVIDASVLYLGPHRRDLAALANLELRLWGASNAPVAFLIDAMAASDPVSAGLTLGVPWPPALILDGIGIFAPFAGTTAVAPAPYAVPSSGPLSIRLGPFPPSWAGAVFFVQAVAASPSYPGGIALSTHAFPGLTSPSVEVRIH